MRHDESTLPGTLERDRVELVADANETIVSMPLAEGASVKVGDVVVVQDRALSAAELDAARAQLAQAEARVDELKNGPRNTTIRAAAARRDAARAQRDDAVRERDRLVGLVARSLVSKSEADRAVAAADSADAALHEAEADAPRASGRHAQRTTRAGSPGRRQRARESRRASKPRPRGSKCDRRLPAPSIRCRSTSAKNRRAARPSRCCSPPPRPYARVHVPEPIRANV